MREVVIFAAFLALAIVLRAATFGDPALHVDDQLYWYFGSRILQGDILYVDLWDRKPAGLFLHYAGMAAISSSVIAYQIVATLFAAATSFTITMICREFASRAASLMAGALYLAMLGPFGGFGGQAPVFYNLFVAAAVLLLVRGEFIDRPRVYAAMALLGVALTFKQTVLVEAAFLGLYSLHRMRGNPGLPRTALVMMAIGAAPTLATFAWYFAIGHFGDIWHATVVSNFHKAGVGSPLAKALLVSLRLLPLACAALLGIIFGRRDKWFITLWLVAATAGFLSVPNFYTHYALPMLVPLCIAVSGIFGRRLLGPLIFAGLVSFSLAIFNPWSRHRGQAINDLGMYIRQQPGVGLLVLDGPTALYTLGGKRPLSPLVFPNHLNHAIERDVSGIVTRVEMNEILSRRPSVVVASIRPRNRPANADSWKQVESYVDDCSSPRQFTVHEMRGTQRLNVWTCGPVAERPN